MKKLLCILILFFSYSFFAQKPIKITSKSRIPNSGFYFKLKEINEDSRCPKGVSCVWAGKVVATIEVYENRKFVEENQITFDSKHKAENLMWFQKYLPKNKQKIAGIGVFPYPIDGVVVKPNKKYVKISFAE